MSNALDIADLYVFRGEGGTALVMDVDRGFHPAGRYEFKIDGDGDTVEDLTYRFSFDADGRLMLRRLAGPAARDPDASGTIIAKGEIGDPTVAAGALRVWLGRAGDPFWIEPVVLRAVGEAFAHGTRVDLSGWSPADATNALAGNTVDAIVLQVPDDQLLPIAKPDKHIGVWAATSLPHDGGWRQVGRAGHPVMRPLFTQFDGELGDQFDAGRPFDDQAAFGKTIAEAVSAVVAAYGTAQDPQAYGATVAARLLPDTLPYTIGTPAVFGFAEMNGRALTDNAPEVMFSLATNTPFGIGLTKDAVVAKPTGTFPYVPVPPG